MNEEGMYAYNFEDRTYDIGDKPGYLEVTVEFALIKPQLRDGFIAYLKGVI